MMEIILSALINDSKAPKWLRYLLVVVVCGLVIFLGVMLALKSPVPAGRVFGALLAALFAAAGAWLLRKIAKGRAPKDPQE